MNGKMPLRLLLVISGWVLALYLSGYRRVEGAKRAGLPLRSYDNALHRVRSKLKRM